MPYALRTKSNFSFLEGASHPEELVTQAVRLGYAGLAITDRATLSGIVRAHSAAKDAGLEKLIIGAELQPTDASPIVLWATDRASYGRLSLLLTVGRRRAPKGECELCFADIAEHAAGLLAGVLPDPTGRDASAEIARYRELFGDRVYLLASLHLGPDDECRLSELMALSETTGVPLVAANDVHYHVARRKALHDVLVAIRYGTTVAAAGDLLQPNAQRHLKPLEQFQRLFAAAPDTVARTQEVADRCNFSLDELRYEYPTEMIDPADAGDPSWLPPPAAWQSGEADNTAAGRNRKSQITNHKQISKNKNSNDESPTPLTLLTQLTWRGAAARYPRGIPDRVRTQIEHELILIAELRYEAYFLTVWDLVRFARSRDILCQGRGSAANSAVCYALGVTSVDPAEMDVLFERFVSRERDEAPDIDVDFEHERREEVLQYLYDKYGRDRCGMTAVVTTYRIRSAVRDVGKALGLSLDRVDTLAKNVEGYTAEPRFEERCRMSGIDPESSLGKQLCTLVEEILGFPRHLSQHVGGMVITQGRLSELVPIENAAMEGRTVITWNKDDLDELGILKVDCLSLGMLTAIRKCFALVGQHGIGRSAGEPSPLNLAAIPAGDPAVYDMICRADTMGVFQIESRAQMSMLPRLRPRCFYDLVIEVAIVRPGPIQGDMVHPYLRRRNGEEEVTYPNEAIREVLHKTLGVPLFQEQAMRLAVVAAGFTPGEADQLRRAMGAWRRTGVIDKFREKLLRGMRERGLTEAFAMQVYHQIRGFGEYGFPESHAASFALLVYVSCWLKHYHPAAFTAALLNSQPMGFYAPAQLVRDARGHDVVVRPIDVNASDWDCTLEFEPGSEQGPQPSPSLRLGLRMVSGLPETAARRIEEVRHDGRFRSLDDFTRRTQLNPAVIERLANADAFGSLELNRRAALWDALGQDGRAAKMPLFEALDDVEETPAALVPLSLQEEVFADYRTAGLSLKAHPVSFYREPLTELGVVAAERLAEWEHNTPVCVAGLVLMRQRPATAKGITFITLEDETGIANLILRVEVWERHYVVARRAASMIVSGTLERHGAVIHVVASRLRDMASELRKFAELQTSSRDFR